MYPLGRPSLEEAHDVLLAVLTSIVQGRFSGLFMEPGEIISGPKENNDLPHTHTHPGPNLTQTEFFPRVNY